MIEVEMAFLIGALLSLLSGLAGFTYARSIDREDNRERGLGAAELRGMIVEAVDEALLRESRAQLRGDHPKELSALNQRLDEGD